jgi:hypothetical protein
MVIKRNHAMALSASLLMIVCLAAIVGRHGHTIAATSTAPIDVDVATVISTTITDYQNYSRWLNSLPVVPPVRRCHQRYRPAYQIAWSKSSHQPPRPLPIEPSESTTSMRSTYFAFL